MQTFTIAIKNKEIRDKIIWFLKHLESEGVEIMSQEDIEDLKLLAVTRKEESIPFSEYIENED
ncbi:MAG: hypothetical protein ACE5EA_10720 [Nitrospirota bacterium]